MKLHVVFNEAGEILGAAVLDSTSPISARPLADSQARHLAADVYVPAEHRHHDLAAVCRRLRVDVGGRFPELQARA
jgi:hypothetical protein